MINSKPMKFPWAGLVKFTPMWGRGLIVALLLKLDLKAPFGGQIYTHMAEVDAIGY